MVAEAQIFTCIELYCFQAMAPAEDIDDNNFTNSKTLKDGENNSSQLVDLELHNIIQSGTTDKGTAQSKVQVQ